MIVSIVRSDQAVFRAWGAVRKQLDYLSPLTPPMYSAQDVMTTDVIRCSQQATVEEAIRLLLDHKVSGAPVVDEQDNLVGIISEYPLLDVVYNPDLRQVPVTQFMTRDV